MSDEKIDVIWKNKNSEQIIFIDRMHPKEFKKIHGVSPHTCSEGGYHDVVVNIKEVK